MYKVCIEITAYIVDPGGTKMKMIHNYYIWWRLPPSYTHIHFRTIDFSGSQKTSHDKYFLSIWSSELCRNTWELWKGNEIVETGGGFGIWDKEIWDENNFKKWGGGGTAKKPEAEFLHRRNHNSRWNFSQISSLKAGSKKRKGLHYWHL